MKEIRSIISKYQQYLAEGKRMALATVVNVQHSSYRRSGARMLITDDGNWIGGISGGCLEGDTLQRAMYAIHKNEAVKVTYDTRDDDPNQIGVGLGCNGLIDVLIVPINEQASNPIHVLMDVVDQRTPSILLTDLQHGTVQNVTDCRHPDDKLNREIETVKSHQKSVKYDHNTGYFIEYLLPEISLYIYGKNYDVIPLAEIAHNVGWKVNIISTPSKISRKIFDLADSVHSPNKNLVLDQYSVALLMSHDYETDKRNLSNLQKQNLKYIGLLGPKKRKDKILEELSNEGIKLTDHNIFGPMGLDTGATSPEEIAISIIAEVRSCFAGRDGTALRDRVGSIHQ